MYATAMLAERTLDRSTQHGCVRAGKSDLPKSLVDIVGRVLSHLHINVVHSIDMLKRDIYCLP